MGHDLVLDQGVDGFRIRHPEQCLREAHEGHPFVGGQSVLHQEGLHDTRGMVVPDPPDQIGACRTDPLPGRLIQVQQRQQPPDGGGLILKVGHANPLPLRLCHAKSPVHRNLFW